jgi:hypothetical protein
MRRLAHRHIGIRTLLAVMLAAALGVASTQRQVPAASGEDPAIAQLQQLLLGLTTLEPALADLQKTVEKLAARVLVLEALLASGSGGGGAGDAVEVIIGTPGQGGNGRPPGTKGFEVLEMLQDRVPGLWDVPGIMMVIDQQHVRVTVPISEEGVRVLESPEFAQFLADTERFSGSLWSDSLERPLILPQGSFNLRVSPDGLRRQVEFDQISPAAFRELLRQATSDQ